MVDYRNRIYDRYASLMSDSSQVFDRGATVRWGRCAYDTFLRGWLPDKKDASLLDVACGGGKLLYFLKARGYTNLQGMDISPEQVALARQVTENVFKADAISYLENHQETYDVIIGFDLVEHFKKEEVLRFLDACYSSLRPGGRLILQTPNAESPWGMKIRYGDFTHEVVFDPNCLKGLLTLCGFSAVESREAGPVIHGVFSLGRYLIWKAIHTGLLVWNLAETGSKGSKIYTRVFLITGKKISK